MFLLFLFIRTGGYSVSVNFRNTGTSPLQNLKKAAQRYKYEHNTSPISSLPLLSPFRTISLPSHPPSFHLLITFICSGWPIGFLLREVFESTKDYDTAVQWLASSSLIAPCYFAVCGVTNSDTIGTLLTRRRSKEEQRYISHSILILSLSTSFHSPLVKCAASLHDVFPFPFFLYPSASFFFLPFLLLFAFTSSHFLISALRWTVREHGPIVQTNIDHWSTKSEEDIMNSIQRRALARRLLRQGISSTHSFFYFSLSSLYF